MESQIGETTILELQRGSPLMRFEISGGIHVSQRRKKREVIKHRSIKFYHGTMKSQIGGTTILELYVGYPAK